MISIEKKEYLVVRAGDNELEVGTVYAVSDGKSWRFGSFCGVTNHGALEFCCRKLRFSFMPKTIQEIEPISNVLADC